MSEATDAPAGPETIDTLRARAEALESKLRTAMQDAETRLIRAELKAEAVRAGMIDLDGLKLIDTSQITLGEAGDVQGAGPLMQSLRRSKPWLFAQSSSSSPATPPPAHPPRPRRATDMSTEEWRAARAELLKRR
jgi:hypothetical protein